MTTLLASPKQNQGYVVPLLFSTLPFKACVYGEKTNENFE